MRRPLFIWGERGATSSIIDVLALLLSFDFFLQREKHPGTNDQFDANGQLN